MLSVLLFINLRQQLSKKVLGHFLNVFLKLLEFLILLLWPTVDTFIYGYPIVFLPKFQVIVFVLNNILVKSVKGLLDQFLSEDRGIVSIIADWFGLGVVKYGGITHGSTLHECCCVNCLICKHLLGLIYVEFWYSLLVSGQVKFAFIAITWVSDTLWRFVSWFNHFEVVLTGHWLVLFLVFTDDRQLFGLTPIWWTIGCPLLLKRIVHLPLNIIIWNVKVTAFEH